MRSKPDGGKHHIGRDPHDGRRVLHQISGGYAVIDLENPATQPRIHRFPDPIHAVRWHRKIGTDRVIGWTGARCASSSPV
ncbi:hypothetical protein FHS43_003134 [Streptosporangium becharense]|uniref:Uncharacterized protein n=1 Tax=Streptosporangium becharense TaxID=1816182 RepID=A0A7W9IL55_9ACTN|nr:hypothetical protein [Streptosporangium becharense]MBB2911861.1 hypothetical protein [Streptosporangium becharense]MBB5822321.1 hypothetical protein [Streptosporangium becharense]